MFDDALPSHDELPTDIGGQAEEHGHVADQAPDDAADDERRRTLQNLARLFELFDCVPFDDTAAHHYGVLRAQLRRSGTAVGANDMLIAAIALAADLTLVTRDQTEFHHIGGLRVEAW